MEFHIIVKTNENDKTTQKLKSTTATKRGGGYLFVLN